MKPCKNVKGHRITCTTHFILTELWHLVDVSAVAGHGAVLASLLFIVWGGGGWAGMKNVDFKKTMKRIIKRIMF